MRYIFLLTAIATVYVGLVDNCLAWDDTKYDTLRTYWPNENPKEITMRYWFLGNEKGFRPHGQSRLWYESGQLQSERYYNVEKPVGTFVRWSETCDRTEETTYENGLKNGLYIKWLEDQNVGNYGHYQNDKKVGLWIYRSAGRDMNNFTCYIDSADYYLNDTVLVRVAAACGEKQHQNNEAFVNSRRIWIEWEDSHSWDWKEKYRSFSYGAKKSGLKEGKWVTADSSGDIVDILYYVGGEITNGGE